MLVTRLDRLKQSDMSFQHTRPFDQNWFRVLAHIDWARGFYTGYERVIAPSLAMMGPDDRSGLSGFISTGARPEIK